MAGGKLTPRQKMINLMYLVFIAMLAMNMSKEVLSAFGLMNERFEGATNSAKATNEQMLQALDTKASESKGEFIAAAATAHKVETASKKFYDFIATLKSEVLTGVESEDGKLPYESMDKADNLDHSWFTGDGYTARGKEVIAAIEAYKADMKAALADKKYAPILNEVNSKFDLTEVSNKEGVKVKFLDYHFKGFPAIASLAKLSAWQNDVKKAESDVIASALGKAAVSEASYSKFQAIVALDKNVYFQGEPVTGKVVLGKYDPNAQFSGFQGPGKLVNGQAVIATTAGAIGEQTLNGSFNFTENGKAIKLPFEGKYVVVPRPNSANISADKMNVVYRGLPNPLTISFAGIGDNNVTASAPGLSPAGKGKYNLNPGSGTEVTVTATGKMTDGKSVSDKKVFRIKNIPAPAGSIGGTVGYQKGAKSRLEASTVGAMLPDFVYDLNFEVTQFAFKVPGQASIVVNGNKIDGRCKAALARAKAGDPITISDIKTRVNGVSVAMKTAAPAIYELQ
ncbi:gliding motility protein GldM [Flavobacterium aquatile]|uniref:Gliding motility protein GldM n=1 Tax=Flavobacterium aquatile LMG 4008 = ATCC 11947 TaxID=1453498 RepID=A0A095STP8_9FLAO|nr:gliding motility protein GldM [Flavobacterium aquatile]KGD67967.1 gliding motility protein GldM [Flavobacterium aquatile LMG 4008 = ATCC 11947]OXA65357.1 gliding motility protein GldM [Flavobacterium aquatile LMG 4008 = ATCC 11947]GEC78917.1 gliding motility protein GldM [Flavobacterium aquatile]